MNMSAKRSASKSPPLRRLAKPGRPVSSGRGTRRGNLAWRIIGGIIGAIMLGGLFFLLVVRPQADNQPPTPSPTRPSVQPTQTGVNEKATIAIPAPAATQLSPTTSAVSSAKAAEPDPFRLGQLMLELINRDRKANGLNPVAWDAIAALAGQKHAQEMADLGYMSHWNIDGHGPDLRYAAAGGLDSVQENVYSYRSWKSDGTAALITDWNEVILTAQKSLMASEGHRANILSPEHTHVGVGVAYSPVSGDVRIAQEFINRYVQLDALPRRVDRGGQLVIRGQLLPDSKGPVVNVAYEPFPAPRSLEQLNNSSTYTSAAQTISVVPIKATGERGFLAEIRIDPTWQPGLYHFRLWVTHAPDGNVHAANVVVEVR